MKVTVFLVAGIAALTTYAVSAVDVLPANRHIVVRADAKSERRAEQGIILPEASRSGEVVRVGPRVELAVRPSAGHPEPQVKPGDVVLFGKYAGSEVTVEGDDLVILREDEILGVLAE